MDEVALKNHVLDVTKETLCLLEELPAKDLDKRFVATLLKATAYRIYSQIPQKISQNDVL